MHCSFVDADDCCQLCIALKFTQFAELSACARTELQVCHGVSSLLLARGLSQKVMQCGVGHCNQLDAQMQPTALGVSRLSSG